jgi:xylulokinase
VAVSAHWSGTVAVDEAGQPIGNAIIWMDSRGAPYVEEITRGFPRVEGYGLRKLLTWLRLTGGVPTRGGKDPIAHILYLQRQEPERFRAAYKFLEPKDYINLKLTGRFATDPATITLHWLTDNRRIDRVDYHPTLLGWTGVPRQKLPDILPTTAVLGPLLPGPAQELDLPAGIPVTMGAPDVHAPVLGSGAVDDFHPHVYVGTSSWFSCHVPFKKTDIFHNMASLPSCVPGRYFVVNEQETAGVSLTFLRDRVFFGHDALGDCPPPEDAYQRFDRLAAQASPGSGGLIYTPWLYGERTPVEESTLRAGFYNLSLTTSLADLVRAVMEGVAYNTRWLQGFVEKLAGRSLSPVNFVGGGALSEVWSQIFADVLNRPVLQVKDPQAAGLRGVAVLAGVSLGLTSFDDYARHVDIAHRFEPRPEAVAVYDQLFQTYLEIYKRNSPIYKRLNRPHH